jgi:hypothetical protein
VYLGYPAFSLCRFGDPDILRSEKSNTRQTTLEAHEHTQYSSYHLNPWVRFLNTCTGHHALIYNCVNFTKFISSAGTPHHNSRLGTSKKQYTFQFGVERAHALSALSLSTISLLNIFYTLYCNLPNRITRSHSDPLRYWPILLQLLCKFSLNPECLMRRL